MSKKHKEVKLQSFIVTVREVHTQGIEVMARDEEHAMDLVQQGEGDAVNGLFEFSHTLDRDTWTVEKGKA